jgi:Restriction endonuclease S subunits
MREMRNSGVEWIGDVPATWQTLTIGSLFKVRNEKVNDTDYPPLSVTKGGVVPQMENVAKTDANDNRKMVLANDFVINSRSDRKQSCGVSPLDGSVSLINTVLYPATNAPIVPAYLNYLLKNHGFAEEFYRWGHGIVADLWTTRWQEMKSILLPIPSVDEQQKIVDSMEIESGKVDELIANVQAQIEKLKTYKHSLITEAVTKGLNPNANSTWCFRRSPL